MFLNLQDHVHVEVGKYKSGGCDRVEICTRNKKKKISYFLVPGFLRCKLLACAL